MYKSNFISQFFCWFREFFSGTSQNWRTFFLFIIIGSLAIYLIGDKLQKIAITIAEIYVKTPKEQAVEQDLVSQYKDTLIQVRRERFNERAVHDQREINWILNNLENNIKGFNHITVWKIHDHGGPLNNGEIKFMTALHTRENIASVDIKEAWNERIMPLGYGEMFQEMVVNKGVYMSDVTLYPSIYKGQVKDNMDYWGTKSLYGTFIKTLPSGMVFITVGFRKVNPKTEDPFIATRIDNAREIIKGLIYDVPESLKN